MPAHGQHQQQSKRRPPARAAAAAAAAGADVHEAAALDRIYQRATELLSSPAAVGALSETAMAELLQLRARAHELLRHRATAAAPGLPGTDPAFKPYPSAQDDGPAFNRLLLSKREFHEHQYPALARGAAPLPLEALWTDSCSGRFELTPTQLFVRNYLAPDTPYTGLLLFHGVGSGKTCSAVTIAEQFDDMRNGVLVIAPPGLREGFLDNIYNLDKVPVRADGSLDFDAAVQCTGTKYSDLVRDRHGLTRDQFAARVSRLVRAKYRFMGPTTFANVVEAMDRDVDRLRKRFSHTLIIVDEAHHLRGEDNKKVTPALRRVLSVTEGVKLVLLTATPMFNAATDVVDLLNLLRANDKLPALRSRDLFDPNTRRLTHAGRQQLVSAARGYVSFMRGDSPFSFPTRLWPSVNGDPLVLGPARVPRVDMAGRAIPKDRRLQPTQALQVVASPMGREQAEHYMSLVAELVNRGGGDDDDVVEEEEELLTDVGDGTGAGATAHTALYSAALQASNVVFPVRSGLGAHGKAGFDAVLQRTAGASPRGRHLQVQYAPGMPAFLAPPLLAKHAPKIDAVVQRVLSSTGVVLVYSRFVWGGLVPLALALEHRGFARFSGGEAAGGGSMLKAARAGAQAPAGSTYAIISGQQDIANDQSKTIAALRSPDNAHGQLIKVVLITDKGSEGLDMRYVREVHVLEPWYHLNKLEQIVGRAARHCSHISLPLAQRNATVYLHALLHRRPEVETVDLHAYRQAQLKQQAIREVERVLRDTAIDCAANRERLYFDPVELGLRTDLLTSQGTLLRGVQVGDPPDMRPHCSPGAMPPAADVDDSTYADDRHAYHTDLLRRLVREHFAQPGTVRATYEQLWASVRARTTAPLRPEQLSIALQNMLEARARVQNAHAQQGWLVYRGGAYLFQPDDARTEALVDRERDSDADAVRAAAPVRLWLAPQ